MKKKIKWETSAPNPNQDPVQKRYLQKSIVTEEKVTEELSLPRGGGCENLLRNLFGIFCLLIHKVIFSRKFTFPCRCLNYFLKGRGISGI